MRKIFLLVCLVMSAASFGQTLKDSLFKGKLKADSNLVKKSMKPAQKSDSASVVVVKTDSAGKTSGNVVTKNQLDSITGQTSTEKPALRFEDNNKAWKKFIDQYSEVIKSEVLPSKKIKRGTYSVMIEYEIGADGMVTTKNVTSTPENDYLVEQIKEKMMANAPQLAPLIREGVARKSSRRQVINFTKEKN